MSVNIEDLLNQAKSSNPNPDENNSSDNVSKSIIGPADAEFQVTDFDEDDEETNYKKFDIFKLFENSILDELIKQSIRENFKSNPKFRPSNDLILTVYSVMKAYCLDKHKHVLLKAPTGSGKTIIGFSVNFCLVNVTNKCNKIVLDSGKKIEDLLTDENIEIIYKNVDGKIVTTMGTEINTIASYEKEKFDLEMDNNMDIKTYMLTSSKMLQEQIEKDVDNRFSLSHIYKMLKGTSNYECIPATKEAGQFVSYIDRDCMGMDMMQLVSLPCFEICPYRKVRKETSQAQTAIINYHYFLNVNKRPNPFFGKRDFAINDECHLVSEIVLNTFNTALTAMNANRALDILNILRFNFEKTIENNMEDFIEVIQSCNKVLNFFFIQFKEDVNDFKNTYPRIEQFKDDVNDFHSKFNDFIENTGLQSNTFFKSLLVKKLIKFNTSIEQQIEELTLMLGKLKDRPNDLLVENEQVMYNWQLPQDYSWFDKFMKFPRTPYDPLILYKFNIRDLSESQVCRDNYLSKLDLALYMSATIPNMDDFATNQLGLLASEYKAFILPSSFKFEQSPIYLCNTGYLNYANFNENIYTVLDKAIQIANERKDRKGIIHTGTFKINQILQEKVNQLSPDNRLRFLFYETAAEKQQAIKLQLANTGINYIICGPSLYEGLDLKYDFGRFNILVKVPYSGLSTYIKAKMDRYPSWYKNDAIQKIEQAIGRTDRAADDWSETFLLDSMFGKIIFDLPPYVHNRVKKLK